MKVKEIITELQRASASEARPELLEKEGFKNNDILMVGDPEQEVHKIATTFIVTVEVIKKAIDEHVDMIISHEPLFCGANPFGKGEPNAWNEEKMKLIEASGIAIYRFHDGMHMTKPDLIYRGWMSELGWEGFVVEGVNNHEFRINQTTLKDMVEELKVKFNMNAIRVFGDPEQKLERVGVLVGGGSMGLGNPNMPLEFIAKKQLDVLICGEIMELILPYFAEDAVALGHQTALIVMGHNRTEECGMKYLPGWLTKVIPELQYTFIEAGDPLYCM